MNYLRKFEYLEDTTIPSDAKWQQSYNVIDNALMHIGGIPKHNPEDIFSCNYDVCWPVEDLTKTYYAPGYADNKWTGKRPMKTISMLLTERDVQLKGKALVNVCPDPYCCNPAHLYVVSNKNKFLDKVRIGIQEDEWDNIRGNILALERVRYEECELFKTQMQHFYGTPAEKRQYQSKLSVKYTSMNLTNDEILMMAVRQGAKHAHIGGQTVSMLELLETYQLKTLYTQLSEQHKELLDTMFNVSMRKTDNLQTLGAALWFIATIAEDGKLKEALRGRGLV